MTNLGLTYRELGHLDEALHWLTRSLNHVGDSEPMSPAPGSWRSARANLLVSLAETYEARSEWRIAVERWEQALDAAQGSPDLGQSCRERLRRARAIAQSDRRFWGARPGHHR